MGRDTRAVSVFRVPVYLPYLNPALTDVAIAEAERTLGVTLPATYLAVLREQNGGYLRRTNLPSELPEVRDLAGIGPEFPSLTGRGWSSAKAAMAESGATTPREIDRLVPFSGDGHYYYCLDYREGRVEPCVTYVDVETFARDEVVAPDFATFLGLLRAEPKEAIGFTTDLPDKKVASALADATGVKLSDEGDQDHGYRVFRAKLAGDGGWAWLEANRCRKGFVRKGDRRYKALRDLLPELVERHPEHADCSWFLSVSEPEGQAAKAFLRKAQAVPFGGRTVVLE